MREPTRHRVTGPARAATPPAPLIRFGHAALQHRPVRFDELPDHLQSELVETAELGHVRSNKGSVGHVEIFRMGSVRTSILGRPRLLPTQRRANEPHTPTTPSIPKSLQTMYCNYPDADKRLNAIHGCTNRSTQRPEGFLSYLSTRIPMRGQG